MNPQDTPRSQLTDLLIPKNKSEGYFAFVRPALKNLLSAFQLNKTYFKAEGDYLFYHDHHGHEVKVLDLLGGFGANLVGHNNPEILQVLQNLQQEKRPFLAQASVRSKSGELAEFLSLLLKNETHQEYISHFANTGAEAVDVAIKHSELNYQRKVQAELASFKMQLHKVSKLPNKILVLFLMRNLFSILTFLVRTKFRPNVFVPNLIVTKLIQHYEQFLMNQPSPIIGLRGAFHGKTLGATALSSNYRRPFERILPHAVSVSHEQELIEVVTKTTVEVPQINFNSEVPTLETIPFCSALALFVEPIQGEGGIHELTPTMAAILNEVSARYKIPLVSDEIQSGLGRSGRFLAGTHFRLRPNIILLSKGLGGSLTKLSVTCIEKSHYVEELGLLQTSTFAEDDYSSSIAIATLRLLVRNNNYLIHQCHDTGVWLNGKLTHLLFKYPAVIKEVRGRGLMIGIEFYPQIESYSGSIRFLSLHHKLTYAISSYLLNVHSIRLAPCLSSPWVLRLEPSVFISHTELERFIEALDTACKILEHHRADLLFHFIVSDQAPDKQLAEIAPIPRPAFETQMSSDRNFRVAFLGYTADPQYMHQWDESLKGLSSEKVEDLLSRVQAALLEPQGVAQFLVKSKTGKSVELQFYGLPVDANYFTRAWTANSHEPVTLIEKATEMAYQNNCRLMSYGGFTSIAVLNGKALRPRSGMGYTTGNSLTAGVAFESTLTLAKQKGVDILKSTVAIVGANGNMGRVLAQLFAEKAQKLILFVRPGKENSAKDSMVQILDRLRSTKGLRRIGIFRGLVGFPEFREWLDGKIATEVWVRDSLLPHPQSPLVLETNLAMLTGCQIIVSTSNADHPIIHPQHIGTHTTIICDLAVPEDVSLAVKQQHNVTCFSGGVVELPEGNNFLTVGSGLPWNRVYACLAEALLLGLERRTDHFSFGHLKVERVKWILGVFHKHGFKIDLTSEKTQGHFRGYSHEN